MVWFNLGLCRSTEKYTLKIDIKKMNADKKEWLIRIIGFTVFHILAIVGIFFFPLTQSMLILFIAMYFFRGYGITIGLHRYFSHRSFKTSRWFQFVLAWFGTIGSHTAVLSWASDHRYHHNNADTDKDIHSPKEKGLWWAQFVWLFSFKEFKKCKKNRHLVNDFAKFPELVWLDKHAGIPNFTFALILWIFGGWAAVFWGYIITTPVIIHVSFLVNSITHKYGTRRYNTKDQSKNNFIVALLTGGEGWHNNHHFKPSSARHGFKWWEIDHSYYVMRILALFKIIWDLKLPRKNTLHKN